PGAPQENTAHASPHQGSRLLSPPQPGLKPQRATRLGTKGQNSAWFTQGSTHPPFLPTIPSSALLCALGSLVHGLHREQHLGCQGRGSPSSLTRSQERTGTSRRLASRKLPRS
uniref:Uncharacterized protein n=1 Tax=Chelydra serpentina TaxID=8475 RepID=A0A8C3SEH2_CHESE